MADHEIKDSEKGLLGPFLGQVTTNSIKIWLHLEAKARTVYVSVHPTEDTSQRSGTGKLNFTTEKMYTDCVTIEGLQPDTKYFYRLWTDPGYLEPLDLQGLEQRELRFYTLSNDPNAQTDFLIMSCHNPTVSTMDGFDGLAVWADVPQIIASQRHKRVRFALLVGDQVYADEAKDALLNEATEAGRRRIYLEIYRKFWSSIHYRRVMCRLPAVMMWDDHDITDGWGSTEDSFVPGSDEFKPEWQRMFASASFMFGLMQASRNPPSLSENPEEGFDCCFRVGTMGFVLMDLRTNRNLKKKRLWRPEQLARVKSWVEKNRGELKTLFVVSPVVFSHGSPVVEDFTASIWPLVMDAITYLTKNEWLGVGLQTKFDKSLGDIRDDIKDSWAWQDNANETEGVLSYLFALQNEKLNPLSVIVLSGDIHTSGFASIYSNDPRHETCSSIPHITSSSVSYSPFNWILEAIYRFASKSVVLGTSNTYSSQISHHFCYRSVAVLSARNENGENDLLKVKYYLEGFPEPQILLFDLNRASHRENITWVAQTNLYPKEYAETANVDVQDLISQRALSHPGKPLNTSTSIVDLMKLLKMDHGLGARKKLAQQLGYDGALDGSAQMNIWLLQKLKDKFNAKISASE